MLNEIPFKLSNRRCKKVKKGKTYLMNTIPNCGVDKILTTQHNTILFFLNTVVKNLLDTCGTYLLGIHHLDISMLIQYDVN